MRVGLFYASNTGYTKDVAMQVMRTLGPFLVERCHNIEGLTPKDLLGYDVLILGVSTWDAGDLPYDWAIFYDQLDDYDFSKTKVIMFGLGDQFGYPETFVDAMGFVYRKFLERGAEGGYGFWPIGDYEFENSLAIIDGQFCGLAIDEERDSELTPLRIDKWCNQIKRELGVLRLCYNKDDRAAQLQTHP